MLYKVHLHTVHAGVNEDVQQVDLLREQQIAAKFIILNSKFLVFDSNFPFLIHNFSFRNSFCAHATRARIVVAPHL